MGWGPLSPWPAKQDFCCRVPCLQGSGDTLESSKLAQPQLQLQRQFVLPGEHVQPVSIGSTIRLQVARRGQDVWQPGECIYSSHQWRASRVHPAIKCGFIRVHGSNDPAHRANHVGIDGGAQKDAAGHICTLEAGLWCHITIPSAASHSMAISMLPCVQRQPHTNACGAVWWWQSPHMVDIVMDDQYRATR